ncbi:hypothetical protein [Aeromicrobium sp.]|uniref:hypothetical protein n=1 Tax=Aeromicrobium sp. TaxID=1871063 RepID=UPI002FC5F3A6
MNLTHTQEKRIVTFGWIAASAGLVLGQLHALSRFETEDGKSDLELPLTRAWAVPAARAVRPLLDWGDPDFVYWNYGKIWLPIFVAMTLCAVVVHRHRRPAGFERWVWRITLAGYTLTTVSVVGDYFTPWTEASFIVLGMPGLALTALGSTTLGVLLLKRGYRPRILGIALVAFIPCVLLITEITSMGNIILPITFAWTYAASRVVQARAAHESATPTGQARPALS